MPALRDPLSVEMDANVARVLRAALRSGKAPRIAEVFIPSPPREFRYLDKGSPALTAHERAFVRAVHYQVTKVPKSYGVPPQWSPKLTWGKIERRGGRWGRPVKVRLFKYGSGQKYVEQIMRRDPWSEDIDGVGSWRAGTRRSMPGDRIDTDRRAAR